MDNNIRIKTIVISGDKPSQFATAITQRREGIREIISKGRANPWTPIHDGTVRDAESLAKWELLIPAYGCKCRKDYMAYKADNPPDLSSAESIWLWGFNLHNWVNRKLGKPELSIEEAYSIWRRDDADKNSGTNLP